LTSRSYGLNIVLYVAARHEVTIMRQALFLGLLLVAVTPTIGQAEEVAIDISVCARGAAASAPYEAQFNTLFRFALDADGRPTDVVALLGAKFVDQREIKSCLHDWQFKGVKRQGPFTVRFYWKNRAWTDALISGPHLHYRIRQGVSAMSQ
jgi:hypothetical protein